MHLFLLNSSIVNGEAIEFTATSGSSNVAPKSAGLDFHPCCVLKEESHKGHSHLKYNACFGIMDINKASLVL